MRRVSKKSALVRLSTGRTLLPTFEASFQKELVGSAVVEPFHRSTCATGSPVPPMALTPAKKRMPVRPMMSASDLLGPVRG